MGLKGVTAVIKPESKKGVRLENPSSAQSRWTQSRLSVHTGRTLARTLSKRVERRHGQLENLVSYRMPLKYETLQYRPEVAVFAA